LSAQKTQGHKFLRLVPLVLFIVSSFTHLFLSFLFSRESASLSNVELIKPWKSPAAEDIPNITTKPKPATIVMIQVPVPILSGSANNGLGIQKITIYVINLKNFLNKNKTNKMILIVKAQIIPNLIAFGFFLGSIGYFASNRKMAEMFG